MNGDDNDNMPRGDFGLLLPRDVMRAVLEAAPAAILVADASGAILLASPATNRLLGGPVTGDAHAPAGGYTLSWPDGGAITPGHLPLSRALVGETVEEIELRVTRDDGSQTIVLATAAPLKSDTGEIWGAVSVFQDITARRRTEEELRKARLDSMKFPDENPSPVFRMSADGQVLYCNPAAQRHPSIRLEDGHLPQPVQGLIGPVMRQACPVTHDVELGGRTFSISFAPFPGESYVNLYTRDITDRRRAEEALRRAHGLLQAITHGTQNLIAAQDERFRYLFFNEAYRREFKRLWGVDLEIGSSMIEAMARWDEDRRKAVELWSRALAGESFSVQVEFGPEQREQQIYQLSFNPIYDEQGRKLGAAHMLQNRTEQVRMENALRELNEKLEERVAERTAEVELQSARLRALASELNRAELRERKRLAKILHDHIQQLIVAARMQLEWIKLDREPDRILAAAQGASGILREALDASRSLTFDLSPPVLNESGLVGALSWQAVRTLEKHHLKVHLRLDSKAEPATEEIRFLVFECARELLFNAVKHAGVSDVQLTLSLAPGNQLRLVVADQGRGFDPALLQDRQPSELTFGLFSVQERLAHIGGRMLIETSPGQGTRITLTVPIGQAEVTLVKMPQTSQGGEERIRIRSKANLVRILIVDDHKIMRQGLVGLPQLEPGMEVVGEAADGQQAIELAEELDPDVIIMDVNLNGMNGIEATRAILGRNPGIKVVGLSMHTDKSVASALHEAGAVAYLTKGGRSEDLVAAIRASCGGERERVANTPGVR